MYFLVGEKHFLLFPNQLNQRMSTPKIFEHTFLELKQCNVRFCKIDESCTVSILLEISRILYYSNLDIDNHPETFLGVYVTM